MNTKTYDHRDFELNPSKYRLFRTARIASPGLSAFPGLYDGALVRLQFQGEGANPRYKPKPGAAMPVYRVWPARSMDESETCLLYACALCDFAL